MVSTQLNLRPAGGVIHSVGTYVERPGFLMVVIPKVRMRGLLRTESEFSSEVEPHLMTMLRLARRLGRDEAEDIVQDALARAWTKRAQYSPERGALRSWLLAITADQARKMWRWKLRRSQPRLPQPDRDSHSDEFVDLERAVQQLPPRQRLAVDCFYFAGLSSEETAVVMRCSEGTVKSTLYAARSALRRQLE